MLECAVVAVPDEVVTNRIKAFVVASESVEDAELSRFCGGRLPHYMTPEFYEFLDELPRSSTARSTDIKTKKIVSTEEQIKDLMASNLHWSGSWAEVDVDYPLLEKQVVDSLGMITLISLLEDEFDVEIDDRDVVPSNFASIGRIAALVEPKRS